ncbi:hypothetical protein Hanom_Chr07g00587191 [Helianthus anomalus]
MYNPIISRMNTTNCYNLKSTLVISDELPAARPMPGLPRISPDVVSKASFLFFFVE